TTNYNSYKNWYLGLKDKFNPVKFNPDQWAQAANDAGMKYLVFTTKHHDGFCMWDTKETDFKISAGPFANNPKADVAKYVFEAFRKKDFMIGAYFSKPDWHSEYYWWPRYATANRNNNYDIRKNPWRWNQFKQFTHNQISELMNNYGSVDILWLDGGWVRPLETVNDEVLSWGAPIPEWSQDIDMAKIAKIAREAQPGLLIVDRTVHGKYENYQTPEQRIPEKAIEYPWESCITLGGAWGYVAGDAMKPASKVIHSLIEVVAKGGSLLLGVGPQPDGTLTEEQIRRLKEIGDWLKKNGDAIYNTCITSNYCDGETFFTQSKDGISMFAIHRLAPDAEMPTYLEWKNNEPVKGSKIRCLANGQAVTWEQKGNSTIIYLSKKFKKSI
ncbi:MAG: alpha-L-fucosidase, partial [Chloroflexia bacterium]|nr:alpha-L-fucosidase [Chloroflexia bacterium]